MAFQIIRRLFVVCISSLLSSCYYLPPEVVAVQPDPPPGKFLGITDLPPAPDSDRTRILFVHGIGIHTGCDPDTLLFHLVVRI
jgi:hypothetical protein